MILNKSPNIRYTTVLPANYVEELKQLAEQKIISSVNNGIREAIEMFLEEAKRELYKQGIADAAGDQRFLERTLESQSDFANSDNEVGGQW